MDFPVPSNEEQRLRALRAYNILDTPEETAFDRITSLAARLFNVPIALVSLIDEERQWFKSCYGLGVRETGRDLAFCSYTILSDQVMVVPDTLADPRFVHNSLVTGEPHIRFYAGAPLITSDGLRLGSFCIIDTSPRDLSEAERQTLVDLAAVVVDEMELKRAAVLVRDESAERQRAEKSLRAALRQNSQLMTAINSATAGILISDPTQHDNPTTFVNPAFTAITGYEPEEILGRNCRLLQGLDTNPETVRELREAVAAQRYYSCTVLNYRKDGTPFWNELTINPVFAEDGQLLNFIGIQTDVTERRRAEEALQQSEEKFRALIENGLDIITILGADGTISYESPSVERLLGYTPTGLIGRNAFELIHPDDFPAVQEMLLQISAGVDIPTAVEFRFAHADGSWRYMESVGTNLQDNPAIGGIVVNSRDITERKLADEALRTSEDRYRSVIAALEEGVILQDATGAILTMNASAERILGLSLSRVRGLTSESPLWRTIHPDGSDFPGHEHPAMVTLRTGMSCSHVIMGVNKYDDPDKLSWISINSQPLVRAEEQTPYAVVTSFVDITERQRDEERLRLLESVAVHANDAILITEAEPINLPGPRIVYANEAFLRTTGYSSEEIMGQTPRILQGPETEREPRDKIRTALEKWKPVQVELLNYRKDGTSFWVELSIVPIANEKGWYTHWVSIQRDITPRRHFEASLRQAKEEAETAQQEAERANRAKSEFLSRMSHELRTPLNAIIGFGQLLEMDELSDEQNEQVQHILTGGQHLLNLINEVLDMARIEADHLQLSLEPVAINAALHQAVDLVRPLAAPRNVSLRCADAKQWNWHVQADQQRLKQVLLNLLANAIKYNHVSGEVVITCAQREDQLHIAISDTGVGISSENMQRLFVPFDRLDADTSQVQGTGLGLALSKRLVEAMGGSIAVESILGQGSTFSIALPLAASPLEQMESADTSAAARTEVSAPAYTVLYVEDNLSNLSLIKHLFAKRPKIHLLTAMQGRIGLDLAREHRPDLILLDLHLPDVPGWEVLRLLQEEPVTASIPVVVLSADATARQVQRLMKAGARAYLTKPLDVKKFLQTLEETLQ